MIPYSVYKILHLTGILMVFLSLGARLIQPQAKILSTYIPGLIMVLVGGFGLLARIGVAHGHMPMWAQLKLGIWIAFASLIFVITHKPAWSKFLWPLVIVLGATAAYLAGNKPL